MAGREAPTGCRFPGVSALVLAGGASSRMGADKALLPVDGGTLLDHVIGQLRPAFPEVLVSAARRDAYPQAGVPVIADPASGGGPLLGLATGLRAARHELVFAVACDIPDIDLDLVAFLLDQVRGADVALPRLAGERWEPLYAVYRRSILPSLDSALAAGERRIRAGFAGARVAVLDLPDAPWLINLNRPEDWRRWSEGRIAG